MIGGVTRHMLTHLSGVPHLQVNRPLILVKGSKSFCVNPSCALKAVPGKKSEKFGTVEGSRADFKGHIF